MENDDKIMRDISSSFFSLNPAFVVFAISITFIIKQMLNSTLFQKIVTLYIVSLRGFEILPLYYFYQYLYTGLLKFGGISNSGFILYNILISLKFSNQITTHIPKRFVYPHRIQQIKTFIEYFSQILLLLRNEYTRYDYFTILNRLLIIILYSNLYELLSNEDIWKKLISFMEFSQDDNTQIYRITKDQLLRLFPSINVAYEILITRSTITYIIFYNICQLIEFPIENPRLNNLFIQLVWFLVILLVITDCFLSFYHTNIFGLFWFYTGLSQWNDIIEIQLSNNQFFNLYSVCSKVTHFIDEYCLKILRNWFSQPILYSNENQYIPVEDPITTTALNQSNEQEEEEDEGNRIILDLYETNSTKPKIHFVGDDVNIQPEDVLVGFVGITGRGKSQLLRCLTGNQIFKSGNRPTTYQAVGTLCMFNNRRYWIIDTPGDSQATEPEKNYYYKKWMNPTYDTSLDHRLKEENGYKYEEAKLTRDVVTKYINDVKQKLHLLVFVFNDRVDQLLKDYYDEHIKSHLSTQSRIIFARTKWDLMHVRTVEARNNAEKIEHQLLIDTFELDSRRVRIVFTTGLIDNEDGYDPEIMKNIRDKGFNIDNLKQMICDTMDEHWDNIRKEKEAAEQGQLLRLSELKEGDHILYFPSLQTTTPYSALIASNQNNHIQVYARTARFINNIRQEDSDGTEYHYFSFDDFRRFTFDKIGEEVPDNYDQDPPYMIRQLYKNSTPAEKARTHKIESKYKEFITKPCDINCDGPSETLKRAKSVVRNTNGTDRVLFKAHYSADFVYACKTGQQPPLDHFWTTYNLSILADLGGYSVRALSYFTHLSFDGTAKLICRGIGKYPVVDAVVCAINCYQEPDNKYHYLSKNIVGGVASTVICVAAPLLTGPAAPFVIAGGMIFAGEIGNKIGGQIVKRKAPKNTRAIMFTEDNIN